MNNKQFENNILPLATKIYPFVARIVGTDNATDCVQEIMIRLWENRKKLDKVKNIGGYAYRVANNYCISFIKKQKITVPIEKIIDSPDINVSDDRKQKYNFIIQEIKRLKEPTKSIIIYRDLDGLEYSEIEELTGFTQANIRMILSRGRKTLRTEYNKNHLYTSEEFEFTEESVFSF